MSGWITGEFSGQCSPGSFGCCPFLSGCSVVVDSLFIVCMYHCLWVFVCFGPCFVMQYFVSFLALQSSG